MNQQSKARETNGKKVDAAELLDMKESLERNPKHPDLMRRYAKALTRAMRFDEALDCWYQIEEMLPEDPVPAHKIAKLVIARSRYRRHRIPKNLF